VTELIEIQNLHYRPETLPKDAPDILRGISVSIQEGEFVAIIGENGSGKTTFIKHLNALLLPSDGTVVIAGMDTKAPENQRRIRALVGMVFQNPSDQIVASTVAEDVAFGLENLNLPTPEIQSRVADQLDQAGLTEEAERPPHLLSGGQVQKLALAGVLARQPKVILFDEPTSMLDPLTRKAFLRRICRLRQDGKTILYVTHHMEETVYADRILVIKDGQVILDGKPEEIFSTPEKLYEVCLDIPESVWFRRQFILLGWNVQSIALTPEALLKSLPVYQGSNGQPAQDESSSSSAEIVKLENVHYTYLSGTPLAGRALTGASLSVGEGEVHGIAGINGSGKSTLLQHINGILRPEKGTVRVRDVEVSAPSTPLREVIRQVGLVFQNPETQFFEVFVGDEIAYGPKQFNLADLRQRVQDAMSLVGLDFNAYKDRRLETLSGGEKRKVALASTLILNPDILMFDEPTAGMDPRARNDLLALFTRLGQQGKTILIASHRLDELAQVTDRLSLMQSGKVSKTGKTCDVLIDSKSVGEIGLEPPLTMRVSKALIDKGWPIVGHDTSTPERLLALLREVSV
jgi:energy-coupling factor transport system ATP-binding protein